MSVEGCVLNMYADDVIIYHSTAKLEMSLINNKNKIGPRTDPCGTPHVISQDSDVSLLNLTNCLRPFR